MVIPRREFFEAASPTLERDFRAAIRRGRRLPLAMPLTAGREPVSLAQRLALALLTLYKMLLSPLFTGSCRFVPSCSDYAREAVMRARRRHEERGSPPAG